MPNYVQAADTALRLISESGRLLPFERTVEADGYDPVTGATPEHAPENVGWFADAVVLPATVQRFRGIDSRLADDPNIVLAKARLLLVSAASPDSLEPQPEDRVAFDGSTWRILGCASLKPADIPILYQVAVLKIG